MEFAKDLLAGLRDRFGVDGPAAANTQCDWSGISARLQAAHAARVELYRSQAESLRGWGGSFVDRAAAPRSSDKRPSLAVNPSSLGDGKAVGCIAVAAEADWLGDGRG
jgi:hypothetical protein